MYLLTSSLNLYLTETGMVLVVTLISHQRKWEKKEEFQLSTQQLRNLAKFTVNILKCMGLATKRDLLESMRLHLSPNSLMELVIEGLPLELLMISLADVNKYSVVFTNPSQNKSSYLHMVSWSNKINWTNLVFGLSRHYFPICSWNWDSCMKTSSSMCLKYISSKESLISISTIEPSLRLRVTINRPSIWPFSPFCFSLVHSELLLKHFH